MRKRLLNQSIQIDKEYILIKKRVSSARGMIVTDRFSLCVEHNQPHSVVIKFLRKIAKSE